MQLTDCTSTIEFFCHDQMVTGPFLDSHSFPTKRCTFLGFVHTYQHQNHQHKKVHILGITLQSLTLCWDSLLSACLLLVMWLLGMSRLGCFGEPCSPSSQETVEQVESCSVCYPWTSHSLPKYLWSFHRVVFNTAVGVGHERFSSVEPVWPVTPQWCLSSNFVEVGHWQSNVSVGWG